MALDLGGMIFLQKKGFLNKQKTRLLDIGPQNVYTTSRQQIDEFLDLQGVASDRLHMEKEIDRLIYFSTPRPDERTTLLSEITDLADIEYNSFDVCPALKTELLDMNYDELPEKYKSYYDVILNFGTTEHIFNQWNSFKIMHDAMKVGGVAYHQLPASGYLDHGYYCYTPVFFRDLAEANGYVIEEMFLTAAGENLVQTMGIDIRANRELIFSPNSVKLTHENERVLCFNIHVIMRKTREEPFRVGLEIATAHAPAYKEVMQRYGNERLGTKALEEKIEELIASHNESVGRLSAERDHAVQQLTALRNSRTWRYTSMLRKMVTSIRGGQ